MGPLLSINSAQVRMSPYLQEYRRPETRPEASHAGGWLGNTSLLPLRHACFDILIKELKAWLQTPSKHKPACFQPVSTAALLTTTASLCRATGGPGLKFVFIHLLCNCYQSAFAHFLLFIIANETIHFLIFAANRLVLTQPSLSLQDKWNIHILVHFWA